MPYIDRCSHQSTLTYQRVCRPQSTQTLVTRIVCHSIMPQGSLPNPVCVVQYPSVCLGPRAPQTHKTHLLSRLSAYLDALPASVSTTKRRESPCSSQALMPIQMHRLSNRNIERMSRENVYNAQASCLFCMHSCLRVTVQLWGKGLPHLERGD